MSLILLLACAGGTTPSEFDTQVVVDGPLDTDTDGDPDAPTIDGEITYSEDLVEDGFGDLYVAVFDKDPVWDSANATAMGQQIIGDVDFNVDGPAPTYSISGIEPRGSAYYVLAFFDDNGTASESAPTPDKGDLISFDLNTFGAPQVVISGDTTKDIDLNAEMPW